MKRSLVIVFFFLVLSKGYTQSCTQSLRLAQSTYEQGRLHEVPSLLQRCLGGGFSQQEQVTAYKLLTLSYLYLEEPEKADDAMLNLLRTDPYFEINPAVDPAEFVALYKTFRTSPIYRIGMSLGVNASQPNVTEAVQTGNDVKSSYSRGVAFQVGITGEIPLTAKLTLHPSAILQQKSFSLKSSVSRGTDVDGAPLFNTTDATERQSWIAVPVVVQYELMKGRYNPYIGAGFSADYLLSSQMTVATIQDNSGAVQEKTVDMERQKFNVSAVIAAGGKLRIFGGYVTAEARFIYGLTPVNSAETVYSNSDVVFSNNIGDSVYKLNSVSVTIGYVQNIFKPRKLTRRK